MKIKDILNVKRKSEKNLFEMVIKAHELLSTILQHNIESLERENEKLKTELNQIKNQKNLN